MVHVWSGVRPRETLDVDDSRLAPPDEVTPAAGAPDRSAHRRVGLLGLLVVFVLLSAALRIPTFGNHVFNTDEAYLATEAQVLESGGHLYVDAVDRKPPLVPYVYAATFELVGSDDLWPVRVLAVLAHALTALLLAVEARRRLRRNWSGVAAGVLYLLAATAFRPQDAQAANFEVFMLPLMTAAMVLGIRRRPAAAGATLAVATLAKQTAATTLLPLVWLAWRARRARGVVVLAAAFSVIVLGVAAVMGFHDFFFWVFTGNGGYLDASGVLGYALSLGARQTGWFLAGHAVLVVLAALAWRHRREDTDLWLWTLSGVHRGARGVSVLPALLPPTAPPAVPVGDAHADVVTALHPSLGARRAVARPRRDDVVLPRTGVPAHGQPGRDDRVRRCAIRARPHRSGTAACWCGATRPRSTGLPTAYRRHGS